MFAIVFGLLLLALDTFAKRTAEGRVAARLKSELRLRSEPEVSLGGSPFLPSLLRGEISEVHLSASDVDFGRPVTVSEVELEMRRVRFSLADIVDERGGVRLQGGDGTATLTEDDVNATLGHEGAPFTVALTPDGVTAISVDGGVEGDVDIESTEDGLTLSAVGVGSVPLDLPGLGGRVRYGAITTYDGFAEIELRVDSMTLDP